MSSLKKIKKTSIDPYYLTRDIIGITENHFESSESYFPLGFNGIYNYKFYVYSNLNRE